MRLEQQFDVTAKQYANLEARALGNDNIDFEVFDASNLAQSEQPGTYDLITTFDAVHDQRDPLTVLRGIRKALADDDVYLAQDGEGLGAMWGKEKALEHDFQNYWYVCFP